MIEKRENYLPLVAMEADSGLREENYEPRNLQKKMNNEMGLSMLGFPFGW